VKRHILIASVLGYLGTVLSLYLLYVDLHTRVDPNFAPMCDISELFSCSKITSTDYSLGLGLLAGLLGREHWLVQPNGLYGALHYTAVLALSYSRGPAPASAALLLTAAANCLTPYFAYVMIYEAGSVCVVCVLVWLVNAALLGVAWRRLLAELQHHEDVLRLAGSKRQ